MINVNTSIPTEMAEVNRRFGHARARVMALADQIIPVTYAGYADYSFCLSDMWPRNAFGSEEIVEQDCQVLDEVSPRLLFATPCQLPCRDVSGFKLWEWARIFVAYVVSVVTFVWWALRG
jgi:hypothetical protein